MRLQRHRWQFILAACLCVLAVGAWFAWRSWQAAAQPPDARALAALTQRCQTAMLRDVCGVMKGSAPKASEGRLFIAGVGEVDAKAFSKLREAGDAMCQEMALQCQTDWLGQACKIGRALYADVAVSASGQISSSQK
jgi:hypothetical protein